MNAIQLLLLSVLVFVLGGIAALLNRAHRSARLISGITGIFGSLAGIAANGSPPVERRPSSRRSPAVDGFLPFMAGRPFPGVRS